MLAVNDLGEPCAGEPHARFDGRDWKRSTLARDAKNSRAGNSSAHMASRPTARTCHRASPRPYVNGLDRCRFGLFWWLWGCGRGGAPALWSPVLLVLGGRDGGLSSVERGEVSVTTDQQF